MDTPTSREDAPHRSHPPWSCTFGGNAWSTRTAAEPPRKVALQSFVPIACCHLPAASTLEGAFWLESLRYFADRTWCCHPDWRRWRRWRRWWQVGWDGVRWLGHRATPTRALRSTRALPQTSSNVPIVSTCTSSLQRVCEALANHCEHPLSGTQRQRPIFSLPTPRLFVVKTPVALHHGFPTVRRPHIDSMRTMTPRLCRGSRNFNRGRANCAHPQKT